MSTTASPNEAQLEKLLEIITSSARAAIQEYKQAASASSRADPVPSIYDLEFHPLDVAQDTVRLKKAVRTLEGAAQQLAATLAPPQHTVINFAHNYDWACVGVVMRAGVPDLLKKHPKGLHVDEIAKTVNLDPGKLGRLMRTLAGKGCFTEVSDNTFAINRLANHLLSTSGPGSLARIHAQDVSRSANVLWDSLTLPDYARSYDPERSPLILALRNEGKKESFFEWMKEDPERGARYHLAMIGLGDVMGSLSVLNHYPWHEIKTLCDVGSSIGTVSIPLARAHPHIKLTCQDLEEVTIRAQDIWKNEYPEAISSGQVSLVPLNFFEQTPVKNQDAYYLRNIIHDWPDHESTLILRSVRGAMGPNSRVLIHDYVLQTTHRKPIEEYHGADVAPEPMLPNFGAGTSRAYQQDLNMWFIHNAKERTIDEFTKLGASAGLRLEKIYDLAEGSVLDFRLA